jgi:CDP-diacylglycerol--glycerol-3-phosphate 3-phosphatidyltransferase
MWWSSGRIPLAFDVGLPLVWFLLLAFFTARVAVRGLPRTERVRRAGGASLGPFLMEYGYWLFGLGTRVLLGLGLGANAVTWLTLPTSLAAGVAFALGHFGLGAHLFILSALLDSLDGQVARARGTSSEAGELWDAVADRYAESFAFAGLAVFYRGQAWLLVLVLFAWSGAVAVSYARAKADASGVDCGGGPMQRHERAAWIAIGAVMASLDGYYPGARWRAFHTWHGSVIASLALIGPLAHYTAARRAWRGYHAVKAKRAEAKAKG